MKKFLLLLDGMTGAGKTTISKLLAKQLPRTAIIGMDKIKRLISDFERCPKDNAIAKKIIFEMTKKYLDLGLAVIVEQPLKSVNEINTYEKLAKKYSLPCYKFQLFTNSDTALNRVINRQKDWEIKVPEERIKHNISFYQDRSKLGFEVIDTSDLKPEEVAKIILDKIK
ncbi:ATP-binding protein [bacterium]|nr:ATP-binding protein [bacterium]